MVAGETFIFVGCCMATNKESLAHWLMVDALIKSGNYEELKRIAAKMIKELEEHKEPADDKETGRKNRRKKGS